MVGTQKQLITWLLEQDNTKKYEVKEYKEKRSNDANAYFHVLINKLARHFNISDDEMKIKIIKDSSFVTSLQNYLMQDLLNILGQINYQSSNPLLKNVLIHNFYDLCYVIPFIEDKMLQSNFSFVRIIKEFFFF